MFTANSRQLKRAAVASAALLAASAVALVAIVSDHTRAGAKPAHVTIFSERVSIKPSEWIPHSAVLIEHEDGSQEWLGFHPKQHRAPAGPGEIDRTNQEQYIDSFVRFELDEATVQKARDATVRAFEDAKYVVGVQDCVSFSVMFCKEAGLRVPPRPNLLPGNLPENLVDLNKGKFAGKYSHVAKVDGTTVFPWKSTGRVTPPPDEEASVREALKEQLRRVFTPTMRLEIATEKLRQENRELRAELARIAPRQSDSAYPELEQAYTRRWNAYAASRSNLDILRVALRDARDKAARAIPAEWRTTWGHLQEYASLMQALAAASEADEEAGRVYDLGVPDKAPPPRKVIVAPTSLAGTVWRSDGKQFHFEAEGGLRVSGFRGAQYGKAAWKRTGDQVTMDWSTNLEPIELRNYSFRGRIVGETITGTLRTTGWDPGRQFPATDSDFTLYRVGR